MKKNINAIVLAVIGVLVLGLSTYITYGGMVELVEAYTGAPITAEGHMTLIAFDFVVLAVVALGALKSARHKIDYTLIEYSDDAW